MLAMKHKEYFFFYTWFFIVGIPLSYMMGSHTFPWQASHAKDLVTLANEKRNKLTVLHFLSVDCDCSKAVLEKLISRNPLINEDEKVFIMGKNLSWEEQLRKKQYQFETNERDYFSTKFDIKAVPQLVIIKDRKILYSGGYSNVRAPASSQIEDEKIIAEISNKKSGTSSERPIFGCLTGRVERKIYDPLKLKYE